MHGIYLACLDHLQSVVVIITTERYSFYYQTFVEYYSTTQKQHEHDWLHPNPNPALLLPVFLLLLRQLELNKKLGGLKHQIIMHTENLIPFKKRGSPRQNY